MGAPAAGPVSGQRPPDVLWQGEQVVLPDWFLTSVERGNSASRLRAWTEGNRVRPLVHGRTYFAALAEALAGAGSGDLVLFADWRGDPDEVLADGGPGAAQALSAAARRGALVKGLLWRSHLDRLRFSAEQNRDLAEDVVDSGGEVLLDQRVRPLGSHHQKFVVIRHGGAPERDVAYVGGLDLGHSRRDDVHHRGDAQSQVVSAPYGATPPWHDVQVELRGPAVRDVEEVFRERWEDPAALSRLPWQAVPDLLRRARREASSLPPPLPDPPRAGTCAVQLLRTYPNRWPGYPFAPDGERSAARGYAKALAAPAAWSTSRTSTSGRPTSRRSSPRPCAPRQDCTWSSSCRATPTRTAGSAVPAVELGHADALELVRDAGGDRVQVLDVENHAGKAVYVHAKVCVVDDVWATVGSDNFNRRSWTHDSELTAAVVDGERDVRAPVDPGGQGDGARRFARDLRLELLREHLDRADGDDATSWTSTPLPTPCGAAPPPSTPGTRAVRPGLDRRAGSGRTPRSSPGGGSGCSPVRRTGPSSTPTAGRCASGCVAGGRPPERAGQQAPAGQAGARVTAATTCA